MNLFYIRALDGRYWTGRAWSDAYVEKNPKKGKARVPCFAQRYSIDDGTAVIEERWSQGIKRRPLGSPSYLVPTPLLVRHP